MAQGDVRRDAERVMKGPGRPFMACPRSRTGAREVWPQARPGCPGALSLWLLSLSREQRESNSAGGPKPEASAHSVVALILEAQLACNVGCRRALPYRILHTAGRGQGPSYRVRPTANP